MMLVKESIMASDICHLPGGTEENHGKSQVLAGNRRRYLSNTGTHCYRCSNPIGSVTSGLSVHHQPCKRMHIVCVPGFELLLQRWSMATPGSDSRKGKDIRPAPSVAAIDVGGYPC